ncbi:glycoside hydrolase family 88 protein [Hymenobacter sp. CRA2]|uniref:glycoside hydrolase family 88 protein n=1 Tax=Hymenobacter sp. CRA2 TaxID=1955620 RepID=UPI00098F03A5|nr:glycoside hydrolase family 88 protein [Hymenobacter sp. CRA2]OON68473.1 glucuronyl hydrolase [Hymenobacter sp. CRA2]
MNRKLLPISLGLSLLVAPAWAQDALYKKTLKLAETQANLMLQEVPKAVQQKPTAAGKPAPVSPRSLTPAGELAVVPSPDWTSGFFPAELWLLYQATGKAEWQTAARTYTARIEPEQYNKTTHDLGFMVYCPVGKGYELTQDAHYKPVILQAARSLSSRFNAKTGTLRSWDHNRDNWQFPVIIDNMMNLELLFEATRLSGDSSFYQLAVTHANTTLRNHFRPDFSSYHVVDYDPATGQVRQRQTAQGYADESAWARGQAWGLYGYTMCYRETRNKVYLQQAENIARFILNHPNMPKDLVPYWDYNAPDIPAAPRDASAAAITASALYELSTYSAANAALYRSKAEQMVKSLAKSYTAQPGGSHGFLLLHSTGHKPANSEIDVPLIYADYYFLEALQRRKNLATGTNVLQAGASQATR